MESNPPTRKSPRLAAINVGASTSGCSSRKRRLSNTNRDGPKMQHSRLDAIDDPNKPSLMMLSDEILMEVLKHCTSNSLFELSRSCHKMENLVWDRRLWSSVDFEDVSFTSADVQTRLEFLNECTTSIKYRGCVDYPPTQCKDFTITESILLKLEIKCPHLKKLSFRKAFFNFAIIKASLLPKTLESLSFIGCHGSHLGANKLFFMKVDLYLDSLQELYLEDCAWFTTHDLIVFSKLPMLKKLSLKGCVSMKESVPYGSIATRFGFKTLEILDLRDTPVSDSDIQCFNAISSLKELYLECPEELRTIVGSARTRNIDDDVVRRLPGPLSNRRRQDLRRMQARLMARLHDQHNRMVFEGYVHDGEFDPDDNQPIDIAAGIRDDDDPARAIPDNNRVFRAINYPRPNAGRAQQNPPLIHHVVHVHAPNEGDPNAPILEAVAQMEVRPPYFDVGRRRQRRPQRQVPEEDHHVLEPQVEPEVNAEPLVVVDDDEGYVGDHVQHPEGEDVVLQVLRGDEQAVPDIHDAAIPLEPIDPPPAPPAEAADVPDPPPPPAEAAGEEDPPPPAEAFGEADPPAEAGGVEQLPDIDPELDNALPPVQVRRQPQVIIVQGFHDERVWNAILGNVPALGGHFWPGNQMYEPPSQHNTVSDRGICAFGQASNVQGNVIWIRAPHAPTERNTFLEKFVMRHYKRITDLSLQHLQQCSPKLTYIDVIGTGVTEEGIRAFKVVKPNCTVDSDFGTF